MIENNNTQFNNNNTSSIIHLEYLNKKYKTLLYEYRKANLEYANFIQTNGYSSNQMSYKKGLAYWGTSKLSVENGSTLQNCEASCSSNSQCSGATFNSVNNLCSLRIGESELSSAPQTDYAIIPKEKELLLHIESINKELTNVNIKLQELTKSERKMYNKQIHQRYEKNNTLQTEYAQLLNERTNFKAIINEFEQLDTEQNEDGLYASQNYYFSILLGFIVVLVIFILIRLSVTPVDIVNPNGGFNINLFFFVLVIIIFIFGLHFYTTFFKSFFQFLSNAPMFQVIGSWFNIAQITF